MVALGPLRVVAPQSELRWAYQEATSVSSEQANLPAPNGISPDSSCWKTVGRGEMCQDIMNQSTREIYTGCTFLSWWIYWRVPCEWKGFGCGVGMTLPKCFPPCAFYWLLNGILKHWFGVCVVTVHGQQQLKQAVVTKPLCLFKPCICPCEHFLHLLLLLLRVTSSLSCTVGT